MIEVGRNSIVVRNVDLESKEFKNANYNYSLYDKVLHKYTFSAFTRIDNDLYFPASVGVEAADTIPTTIQLKNGSGNYTAVMAVWGQVTQGTLAGLTLSAGASGQVLPMADFATSGRFAMVSGATGVVNLNVNTAAAETVQIFYGPGPGTDQLFLGGNFQMTFA